jgi:hypothetical protein
LATDVDWKNLMAEQQERGAVWLDYVHIVTADYKLVVIMPVVHELAFQGIHVCIGHGTV